jgi:hypothetical protein
MKQRGIGARENRVERVLRPQRWRLVVDENIAQTNTTTGRTRRETTVTFGIEQIVDGLRVLAVRRSPLGSFLMSE